MYAAAGGASIAGRKARHTRPVPSQSSSHAASVPGPTRAYSCSHWEALVRPPAPPPPPPTTPACDHGHLPEGCECAHGRAAWQERAALYTGGGAAGAGGAARRCSVPGTHFVRNESKWNAKHKVRDTHYGSGSDSECESDWGDGDNRESPAAATLLYAGLAILALGLVVYFVGTGDKGFRTPALRMVGPSLILAGLACCALRLILCAIEKPCCSCPIRKSRRVPMTPEEMPLAERRSPRPRLGPLQCSPARRPPASTSSLDLSSMSSSEEEERLRRYRIAPREPPKTQPPPQPPPQSLGEPSDKRRNVSFSPPPKREIVLSPSQLRP